jgi:hypothetical protein
MLLSAAPAVRAQEPTPNPTPNPTPTPNFPPVVQGQQLAPTPDWLYTSDAEFQVALDDGYNAKTPKEALEGYIPIELSVIQRDPNARISIESPLHCAVSEGYFAAKDLADEPTVAEVRRVCEGLIGVYVLHFSRMLRANWPVMLQHKNTIYQPYSRVLGPAPKARRYLAGLGPKVPGYMYDDVYMFKPEEAWTDEATLLWSDEHGAQHSQKVDLTPLVREEEKLRAEINQEP